MAYSQCPQLYDGNGVAATKPYWVSCTGGAYTLNLSSPSSIGSYTIIWGDGTANSTGASLAANTILTHNYASAIDTFIVNLITTAPSCTLTGVVVMEKPVNASIQIPVGGVTTACAPATLEFENSSTNVSQTTSFSWNFGDGSAVVNYNYTNAGQIVSHTYNKGTVNCQTIVTLSAKNYCTSSPTTAQFNPIQIYDKDQAAITPSAFIKCWPDNSFTFTNTTSRNCLAQGNNGIRYEKWDFGNYWGKGHDSIINWTAWPPSFPKTLAYPGLGNYTVMLYDSNECGIDTSSITVSIVNRPTAGLKVKPDTVCLGTAMSFTNTSSTGYSYKWNFGDGGTSTSYNPPAHTYASAGNYTVYVVAYISAAASSCKDTARLVVTVLPSPVANFSYTPQTGCNSITTAFTDESTSTGVITSWQWNFGNSNTFNGQAPPAQTYTTGTYTVSLLATSANNCKNTKTQTITVYQKPVPQFTTSVACLDNKVTFTDQSTHASGDNITTWQWIFGDGSTKSTTQNPTHTYTTATTYSVQLNVATAHCTDSITIPIVINPLPLVSYISAPDSGCPSLVVTFTNTSTGASTYTWNYGNGSTSNGLNPTETFSNTTNSSKIYTVSLVGSSPAGCKDSTKSTIKVFGKPTASFTSNAQANCAPFNVTFTNTSLAATSYLWDFGDGTATSTSVTPTHMFQNTTGFLQNYTVTLHITNAGGCQDSTKQVVQAYPQAQFNFQSLPDSGCTQLHVNFPSTSGAVLYQWNFGDGTPDVTGASPSHTFTNTSVSVKTFTVQLIATNAFNCIDTANQPIKVFPKPTSVYTLSQDSGCAPFAVSFINASINATSYNWFLGDGTTTTSISTAHTYTTSSLALDSFQVKLVSYNTYGCTDTTKKYLYVFPKVTAGFTSDTMGCSALKISYINSTQGANTYSWNFGDASTPSTVVNPIHTYTNTSASIATYTTQLIAKNNFGCTDTAKQKITVLPKPTASFSLSLNSGCTPFIPVITNSSVGATAGSSWNFGDGGTSTITNPSHTFTNTSLTKDSFNIQLVIANTFGCKDTASKYVHVLPRVTAGFTSDTIGCSPLKITFINSTQGASLYTWNFGDASATSNATNPTHTYTNTSAVADTYTTQLVANNSFNCPDSARQKITVLPKPKAAFSLSLSSGCTPFTPLITNSSVGATAGSSWSFGDGGTSTTTNPTHTFTNTSLTKDSFNIQLVIANTFGCKDTASKYVHVLPRVTAGFTSDTIGCSPLKITFINSTQGASLYTWNFGDASATSNATNPTHTYTNTSAVADTYTAQIVANNSFNCPDSARQKITVLPKPTASFSLSLNSGCTPFIPVITNSSVGATAGSSWNFGDGGTSTITNPSHTFTNTSLTKDSFNIQLVIANTFGCKDTASKYVHVLPRVTAGFTSDTIGCSPLKITFINSTQGASLYTWNFGDASATSNAVDPIHTYTNTSGVADTYTAQVVANNSFNCPDSSWQRVTVLPKPKASFNLSPDSGCTPLTPVFNNTSVGATGSSWNFGDGGTSASSNPAHTFINTSLTNLDSFNVQLIVVNGYGCKDTMKRYAYVFPKVNVSFYADTPICAPVTVLFHDLSQGVTTYTWSFGDGSPLNNTASPTHVYNDTTANVLFYPVTLTASNSYGCASSYSHTYIIYPKPLPVFTANPALQTFPASTISLVNNSHHSSSYNNSWTYGDGTTSTQINPGNHIYTTWGTYSVTLTQYSAYCRDSVTKVIVIKPPKPIAGFKGSKKGCAPLKVTFENTSQYATSYYWDFGDGNSETVITTSVTNTYYNPGTYTIKLLVTGPGGKDSIVGIDSVIVYPTPSANFIVQPLVVTVGVDPIVCALVYSKDVASYIWNFGDNTIDTTTSGQNQTHIYQKYGDYVVTLTVVSSHGCTYSVPYTPLITAQESTSVQVPNAFTPNPGGPSADGVYDPTSRDNDIFHPNISGLQTYELDIFNRWGELLFVSKDINVGWDGYYKGKLCEQSVYVWKIRGLSITGQSIEKAGDLTLLR